MLGSPGLGGGGIVIFGIFGVSRAVGSGRSSFSSTIAFRLLGRGESLKILLLRVVLR